MRLDMTGSRVPVSRLFGLVILLLVLFTSHSFSQGSFTDVSFEVFGLILLTMAMAGRLWALLYMAGRKKSELIREGPYSIMRHPLYAFSFVGVIGIGLASENVLVLAALVVFFLLYYPVVIRKEEAKLIQKFGDSYLDYRAQVPAFIPNIRLYQAPEHYNVKMPCLTRSCRDAIGFVLMFCLLHSIEWFQQSGALPVLWRVP